MKKTLILCSCLLMSFYTLDAQVTIGSAQKAKDGALLDLVEKTTGESEKGLLLPRVELSKKAVLKMGDNTIEASEYDAHTGLMVYNVKTVDAENLCQGLYMWDGTEWQAMMTYEKKEEPKTFQDGEGNTYTYQQYGDLYWMTQNLRTIYKKGIIANGPIDATDGMRINPAEFGGAVLKAIPVKTEIPAGADISYEIIYQGTTDKVTIVQTRDEFVTEFGLLYNADQTTDACPDGWRMPTHIEWEELIENNGGVNKTVTANQTRWQTFGKKIKRDNNAYISLDGAAFDEKPWGGALGVCPESKANIGFNSVPAGSAEPLVTPSSNTALFWGMYVYYWTDGGTHYVNHDKYNTYFYMNEFPATGGSATSRQSFHSVRCVKNVL